MTTHTNTEAPRLLRWFEESDGFKQGTRTHHKWVIQAEQELRRQHDRITELELRLEIDPHHRYDGIYARDATIKAQEARIAELEKDAARLLYATKDYDGFFHVMGDKHDFASECMEESGRSEPTIEDELNGVRRLIDAAIAVQTIANQATKNGEK